MRAGGEWTTVRWSAALISGLLLFAGSGASDDDSAQATSTTDAAPTSTSESTTTSTTAPPTRSHRGSRRRAGRSVDGHLDRVLAGPAQCLADTASCDVEATIEPYLGEPFGTDVRSAIAEWAADGIQFRGIDTEEYIYRRHDLALENPPTYALELCILAGPQAVYQVSESGDETLLEDRGDSSARILQLLLEERSNDELIINVSKSSDAKAEGDSCTVGDGE